MHSTITQDDLDGLLPMVRSMVNNNFKLPTHVAEFDELVSVGVLGALEAAPRWNPDKGTKFTSFVHFRAYGAIRDFLRKAQTGTRRGTRRDPDRFQMISMDAPVLRSAQGRSGVFAFSDVVSDDAPDHTDTDPYLRAMLADAMSSISEDARLAVWLAYGAEEKWTRREIGEQLGRTEAATYQLIHHTLKKLRVHASIQDYKPVQKAANKYPALVTA